MLTKLRFLDSIGVTRTSMANEIGVAKSTVNAWINGIKGISASNEVKVEAYLENFKNKIIETL